jgi:F420-dependent hydroxymycolic acid dehydrogenase
MSNMPELRTGPVTQAPEFNRRNLLKSAASLAGISAVSNIFASNSALAQSDNPSTAGSSKQMNEKSRPGSLNTPDFTSRMIGFMLPHEQFPVPELVQLGVAAEQAGFDLLATSDHLQPWQANEGHAGMAWVTMGAIGAKTHRVWIGPTVTCPTFRYNPAVVAEGFASLDLLCPGRIFLGIGSGEAINEQAATGNWPKWDERSERFIEAAGLIRELWKGQQVQHKGKYYNVNAKLYDPPTKTIPLLLAANGPKAMRRSGQYGDGLITDPKTWKQHKNEFYGGAQAAGKDPKQMPVLVEQYVVVGNKSEVEKAAQLWRFGPKAFKKYYNVRDPQEIEKEADAEVPLEQVYEGWPTGTDPNTHIKVINELFESGATIVNIHSGQNDLRRVIDFYGKEVLPGLKQVKGQKAA